MILETDEMRTQFSRTELLIGRSGIARLQGSKVTVFGIGGVGSFTVEALARLGIGHFKLIDPDKICLTNLNRQLIALHSTLGQSKVQVMKKRIEDINPQARVETYSLFYTETEAELLLSDSPDYVIDAIDTVKSKVSLAKECYQRKLNFISSMGTGNRLDATGFRIADISKTSGDPLAKAVRKLLRKEGIYQGIKVLYSPHPPLKIDSDRESGSLTKKQIPGSVSFVPSVAGLLIAGEVARDLLESKF
jgi:tRNA A37 threonylcarbamoyladenosine dehydratase